MTQVRMERKAMVKVMMPTIVRGSNSVMAHDKSHLTSVTFPSVLQ